VIYSISTWISVIIKPLILVQDMSSGFNRVYPTQTQKVFSGEKSESIFTNWSIIDDCSDSFYTKQIRVAKELKL